MKVFKWLLLTCLKTGLTGLSFLPSPLAVFQQGVTMLLMTVCKSYRVGEKVIGTGTGEGGRNAETSWLPNCGVNPSPFSQTVSEYCDSNKLQNSSLIKAHLIQMLLLATQ